MWLRLIPVGLILLPVIEIALFVQIGGLIGVWGTLALVFLAALAGMLLLHGSRGRSPVRIRQALQEGRDPGPEMFRGTSRFLAALLLILPGFFSDFLAVLLLLPPVPDLIWRRMSRRFETQGFERPPTGREDIRNDVINGDYRDITPGRDDVRPRPPSGWTRHDDG